jgi:hypothetical protein
MSKICKYFGLVFLPLLFVSIASANSVSLGHVDALQNNGLSKVDLFTSPGVTLGPTSPHAPFQLSLLVPFSGTVPGGSGNTLVIAALMVGSTFTQSFAIPAGTYPNFSEFVTFTFPGGLFHAVPVNLSVQLFSDNGRLLESSNYSFKFAEPVPEPATLVLVGSGILASFIRRRRTS